MYIYKYDDNIIVYKHEFKQLILSFVNKHSV